MPIKIGFMHYMKSTRVMLLLVFEEFEVAYIFCYFILFIIIVNLLKANFSKNLGGCSQAHSNPSPTFPRIL